MSTLLELKETRTVLRDSNNDQIYRNVLECTDEGPLDDTGVFVFQIFNSRNALADIFQRVSEVIDMETYVNDRDEAIANGDEYWRSSTYTLEFDNVDVAVAGVQTVSDRVNTLVNAYVAYQESFETSPDETLYFPTTEPTVIESRKTDYTTAVSDYEDAVEAAADDLTAKEDADAVLAAATTALKEWQEEQDAVCGGNTSGEGNRYGVAVYMGEVANGFLGLLDNSGAAPFSSSASTVETALDTFFDAFDGVKLGGSSGMRRLTVSYGTQPTASDIGKLVTGTDSGATGYLTAYDNVNGYWWIAGITGSFNTSDAVSVTTGTGQGDVDVVSAASNGPLYDSGEALRAAWAAFAGMLNTQATPLKTTAQDSINSSNDDSAPSVCSQTTTIASTKTSDVTTAEADVQSKEAAYITSLGAIQAAYAVVIVAYDAVKVVCPSWSPDPPLPALP